MSLEIQVANGHFMVSDGCCIHATESNIIARNNKDLDARGYDTAARETSDGSAPTYLFYRNVALVHSLYMCNAVLEVRCPECRREYTLGKKEFEVGEKAFQKILEIRK